MLDVSCLTRLLGSLLVCCCLPLQADEANANAAFGNSYLPIWSPLSQFEATTISALEITNTPDAENLLAMYTLASGDDRQGTKFQRYNQSIDNWLKINSRQLKRKKPKAVAEYLFQAMHDEFFLPRDDDMSGYSADQSQITQVFVSKTFNCLSSALLYMVIAKKMDFDVQGVLIPSHAFVQLNLKQNQKIDIETTSYNGFNTEHNEAFYEQDDLSWFTDRDLEPPTYNDYLNRDIISPKQMGLLNMWSQHTAAKLMDRVDRMRLAEIRAHLMPDDLDAQKNRLVFYHEEFERLEQNDDYATLARFYQTISPYIKTLDEDYYSDSEFVRLIISVKSEYALTQIKTGQEQRGLALARQLLTSVEYANYDASQLEHNLFYILNQYITSRLHQGDFENARYALSDIEGYCLQNDLCANSFLQIYARWGEQYWQQKDWQQTVDVYKDYLLQNTREDLAPLIRQNMEKAFVNWANEHLWEGEWELAQGHLQSCLNELNQALLCREQLQKIQDRVDQGYY